MKKQKIVPLVVILMLSSCIATNKKLETAQELNTVKSYKNVTLEYQPKKLVLKPKYKNVKFKSKLKQRHLNLIIAKKLFDIALKKNTLKAYITIIKDYPNTIFSDMALSKIYNLLLVNIKSKLKLMNGEYTISYPAPIENNNNYQRVKYSPEYFKQLLKQAILENKCFIIAIFKKFSKSYCNSIYFAKLYGSTAIIKHVYIKIKKEDGFNPGLYTADWDIDVILPSSLKNNLIFSEDRRCISNFSLYKLIDYFMGYKPKGYEKFTYKTSCGDLKGKIIIKSFK